MQKARLEGAKACHEPPTESGWGSLCITQSGQAPGYGRASVRPAASHDRWGGHCPPCGIPGHAVRHQYLSSWCLCSLVLILLNSSRDRKSFAGVEDGFRHFPGETGPWEPLTNGHPLKDKGAGGARRRGEDTLRLL